MRRLEQITRAGYKVEVQWECECDEGILARHPELKTRLVVQHNPLNTRYFLYGGRREVMRLHYKIQEGETMQYIDPCLYTPS